MSCELTAYQTVIMPAINWARPRSTEAIPTIKTNVKSLSEYKI